MNKTWTVTAATALVVAVLAFFIGRSTNTQPDDPIETVDVDDQEPVVEPVSEVDLTPVEPADEGPVLSDPQARESHLRRELERERAEIAKLKDEIAARDKAAEEAKKEAVAEGGARFVYPGAEKIVDGLDVEGAGKALATMSPLIGEFMRGFAEGKPDMKLQGQIQQHNSVLIAQALKVSSAGTSGHGVNGAFTHPAVQVNYIHATLLAAEKPLSEKQEAALKEIGDRFVKDEARRVAGYNEGTFALQKLIDEGALKDRFFAAVDAMLSEEQREILHPAGTAGRLRADLFSSGLVWGTVAGKLAYKDRESLAASMAAQAMQHLQLGADQASMMNELAQDYVLGFSDAYLAHKANGFDQAGIFEVSRVRVAAEQLLKLLKTIADRLPIDGDIRKRVIGTAFVLVPIAQ